jgi:hypothetical protein
VRELLADCFSVMRGSVADMLPSGWELSATQSLAGADPDLMAQREKHFFVCVDGSVFSKDFAAKAQSMQTVSLGQVKGGTTIIYIIPEIYFYFSLLCLEFFCPHHQ